MAFVYPLPGGQLSPGRQFTGPLPAHSGMDLIIPGRTCGAPVVATAAGTARRAENGGGGHGVVIDHGGGVETGYWHLSVQLVRDGQSVTAGQRIGLAGASGTKVSGCNLHFEVKVNGQVQDPAPLLGGKVHGIPEGAPDSFPRDPGYTCPPGYSPGTVNPRIHGALPGSPWWNRPTNDDGTVNACIRSGLQPGDNTALTDVGESVTAAMRELVPVVVNVGVVLAAVVIGWNGVKRIVGDADPLAALPIVYRR